MNGVTTDMPAILVAADDRTGALEAAGAVAQRIGRPVPVVAAVEGAHLVRAPDLTTAADGAPVVVVDLGSRHLTPAEAARRAGRLGTIPAGRHVHKIDSTLRGNWADELVARAAGAHPVLVIPALPALGRLCRDGVVTLDGRPVTDGVSGHDRLAPPASARPLELLVAAGADVADLVSVRPDDVGQWLAAPRGIAVCDASTDDDIERIADSAAARDDVVLAGTSVLAAALAGRILSHGADAPRPSPVGHRPLVVVGSLHPAASEQVRQAVARGATVAKEPSELRTPAAPTVPVILLPPPARPGPVARADAAAVAEDLARRFDALAAALDPDVIVIVGGDTAAAVLGPDVVDVSGTLAPGTPWGHRRDDGCVVVTRAGGFGGPDALVELLWGTLAP